ncbi:aminotransferase class V-fold PLP-dependent enzyme [Shigella sonnei]
MVKPELLVSHVAWPGGGKRLHEVSFRGFDDSICAVENGAGTPNVAGVIGLSAAPERLTDYDINGGRKPELVSQQRLQKKRWRWFQALRSSAARIQCRPLILRVFITANTATLLAEYGIACAPGSIALSRDRRIRRNRHTARLICAI